MPKATRCQKPQWPHGRLPGESIRSDRRTALFTDEPDRRRVLSFEEDVAHRLVREPVGVGGFSAA